MMKVALFTVAIAFATGVAVAAPHDAPVHKHRRPFKRAVDVVTDFDVVTVVDVVTAIVAEEIVYVNTDGVPVATSYSQTQISSPSPVPAATTSATETTQAVAPTSSASTSTSISTSTSEATIAPSSSPESTTAAAPTPSPDASTTASAAAASQSSASSSKSGAGFTGYSLSYSPYGSNGACKPQQQIDSDVSQMTGYDTIRIYGTDCNQTAMVLQAARAQNMDVFAGVYDISQTASEIQLIVDAAAGDWSNIPAIAIGNELVNDGLASVSEVVSAIGTARAALQQADYPGQVATVDTFNAVQANPELCQASDFAAANCHAFFDSSVTAEAAGEYVLQQAEHVSQACGGMTTVITESGWPWSGQANGDAIPSAANQQAALDSLRAAFSGNIVLFSAFDDLWKSNAAGTYDAEQFWGILNKST